DRFLYVLLRPHWGSWLVKGGYSITLYGGFLTLLAIAKWFALDGLFSVLMWATGIMAVITAIYTAFLFAQAKGRDFWQSPSLALHMLVHAVIAGAASLSIVSLLTNDAASWTSLLSTVMIAGIIANLFTITVELTTTHPTQEAKLAVKMITKGRYRSMFWAGSIVLGNLIPLAILFFASGQPVIQAVAGLAVLVGIYFTEKIWVEAPQRIALS
ncbi:MAG: polysulfide reductase NrfD, partial [Saprospiraceae bacterium]|nr:polysulfide reductase NrfD [Saprospiraceae bacterium]